MARIRHINSAVAVIAVGLPTGEKLPFITYRGKPMTHGTSYGYNKKACRCEKCKNWKAKVNADRKVFSATKEAPRLRAADLVQFNRVCHYADSHSLTLKQAAKELLSYV